MTYYFNVYKIFKRISNHLSSLRYKIASIHAICQKTFEKILAGLIQKFCVSLLPRICICICILFKLHPFLFMLLLKYHIYFILEIILNLVIKKWWEDTFAFLRLRWFEELSTMRGWKEHRGKISSCSPKRQGRFAPTVF